MRFSLTKGLREILDGVRNGARNMIKLPCTYLNVTA